MDIDIDGNLEIGNTDADCNSEDNHFYMFASSNLHLRTGGNKNIDINHGFIYAKGWITLDTFGDISLNGGSITSDGILTVKNATADSHYANCQAMADGADPDNDTDSFFDACPILIATYLTGPFDAWDIYRNGLSGDKRISTKIVNKDFNLTIASLNRVGDGYETKPGVSGGSFVYYDLYDADTAKLIKTGDVFDANSTDHLIHLFEDETLASTNVKVGFKFCATYEKNETTEQYSYYVFNPSSNCNDSAVYECNATTTGGNPTWHRCYSTDAFALRPDKFAIDLQTLENSTAVAGKGYLVSYSALDGKDNATLDYNQTEGGSFIIDSNLTLSHTACENLELDRNRTVSFEDGLDNNLSWFNTSGSFDLRIRENVDAEYAIVDREDTDDADRLIAETTVNLSVIPSGFNVTADVQDHHNTVYTYLHDIETSSVSQMAATLDANVSAIDTITTGSTPDYAENYVDGCMAMDGNNLLVSYKLTPVTPSGSLSKIYYMDINNATQNGSHTLTSEILSGEEDQYTLSYGKSFFAPNDEQNGTGRATFRFNFNRKVNKPVNPFTLTVSDLNMTHTSPDIKTIKTVIDLNEKEANFYYGRAKASKDYYDDVSESNVSTPISVVVYCDKGPSVCTFGMPTGQYNWYISPTHNSASDGIVKLDATASSPISFTATPTIVNGLSSNNVVISLPSNISRPADVEISFENSDAWLIYSGYNIHFTDGSSTTGGGSSTAGWIGYGNTGYVVDSNSSFKKNKRLNW